MAPSPLAIRPRQHHRRSTRSRRPTSGLPGRTGEPLAMDHATSPRIRRAHPARGNNRPRQRVGHQGRAHTDRGRMVRALGPPSRPLPKTGDKTVWWWNPPKASARWWWCRVYHQGKYTPDGVIFRQYGPAARFDHHHPADPGSSTRPADESSTSVRTWQPRHVKYSAMRASPPSAPTTGSPSSRQRRNWLCTTWQQKARPWRSAHCRPSATATRPAS